MDSDKSENLMVAVANGNLVSLLVIEEKDENLEMRELVSVRVF
jgi:hypothetical protein